MAFRNVDAYLMESYGIILEKPILLKGWRKSSNPTCFLCSKYKKSFTLVSITLKKYKIRHS